MRQSGRRKQGPVERARNGPGLVVKQIPWSGLARTES